MTAFKKIISRNILLYVIVGLILARSVDWDKCFLQRGRYLLGIFYNGHFLNSKDGLVYEDFLKRHGTTHDTFKNRL